MKKLMLILATFLPVQGWAALATPRAIDNPLMDPLTDFSSYAETRTLEWGCPVADRILAASQDEAIQQVRAECVEQAARAAAEKPEVMDVIQTKVIWPDVSVLKVSDGYHLSGTFFLETTVVQRMSAEVR